MTALRRILTPVAVTACAVLLASAFLPWVQGAGGSAAGWGSEAHPQLRGMLIITCAGVALVLLAGGALNGGVRRRVVAELAAAVLLGGLIAVSSVIADPGSYVSPPSAVRAGAWLAMSALVVAIAASVAEALVPEA